MPPLAIDLNDLVKRMADRKPGRTEANVQSDLHMLLTAAPSQLEPGDLNEIVLESPAGQRRRADVEAGFAVFEVKRDLCPAKVRADPERLERRRIVRAGAEDELLLSDGSHLLPPEHMVQRCGRVHRPHPEGCAAAAAGVSCSPAARVTVS